MDAISGLKALGVRELNYKLIFIAQYVSVGGANLNYNDETTDKELEDLN